MIAIVLLLLGISSTNAGRADILKSENFVYVRSPELKYARAERFCNNRFGTSLASVHSDSEMDEITSLVADDVAYIGFDDKGDKDDEGIFSWIDGSNVDYTKWAPGEPNQWMNTNEDCAVTWLDGEYWNDAPCNMEQQFVCARSEDDIDESQVQVGFLNFGESSGQTVSLSCKKGINAIASIYGANCRYGDEGSLAGGERQDGPLKEDCYGEKECTFTVNHNSIGDPCIGTVKDFYYAYTCNGNGYGVNIGSVGVSEASGQSFTIECNGNNRVIKIANAIYGLNCGLNSQSELDVTSDVEDECNGLTSCTYNINHNELGDPCVGIVKDFVYAYQCVPSSTTAGLEYEIIEYDDEMFDDEEEFLFEQGNYFMTSFKSFNEASILVKGVVISMVVLVVIYGIGKLLLCAKGKHFGEYEKLLDNQITRQTV